MLLTSAMRSGAVSGCADCAEAKPFASLRSAGTRPPSIAIGIFRPPHLNNQEPFLQQAAGASAAKAAMRSRGVGSRPKPRPTKPKLRQQQLLLGDGRSERLVEIGEDVVDVLDADAEANHFRRYAGFELLFRRQLAVRGGGRMAGQRFGVAHVDHALEKLHGVETFYTGFETAFDAEGKQGGASIAHVALGHGVERAIGKAGVIDPGDLFMAAQKFGDLARVGDVALDAQG